MIGLWFCRAVLPVHLWQHSRFLLGPLTGFRLRVAGLICAHRLPTLKLPPGSLSLHQAAKSSPHTRDRCLPTISARTLIPRAGHRQTLSTETNSIPVQLAKANHRTWLSIGNQAAALIDMVCSSSLHSREGAGGQCLGTVPGAVGPICCAALPIENEVPLRHPHRRHETRANRPWSKRRSCDVASCVGARCPSRSFVRS